jgi:uncharacterized protein (TIGR03118 family)
MSCNPVVKETDLVVSACDPNLINAWGIIVDVNYIYVVANGTSVLIRYDLCGKNAFNIGFYTEGGVLLNNVNPTGIVRNPTNGYLVSDGTLTRASIFIIASESGDIFGYNQYVGGSNKAFRIYAGSVIAPPIPFQNPVYKGLAATTNYIFAADFLNGKIDMFINTGGINSITLINSMTRYALTAPNFASPFNVVYLNNQLYVLYAFKNSTTDTDDNGTGGYIDIHNENGIFVRNFNNTDPDLKSPWALIAAPDTLCNQSNVVLVGNFGSGRINIYNAFGVRIGTVYDCCSKLRIDGLWGLNNYSNKIYFAAGPNSEAGGLVGYLKNICVETKCKSKSRHKPKSRHKSKSSSYRKCKSRSKSKSSSYYKYKSRSKSKSSSCRKCKSKSRSKSKSCKCYRPKSRSKSKSCKCRRSKSHTSRRKKSHKSRYRSHHK